ncbi:MULTISPECIES: efflux RND transporter periplasmic adaptor subunit [unclassified Mesorhizobium]|uniref:efflux RND transporter periplasmic adaptor subunit n=1 Tax=unclassified Mesorhizobium TaxID=325217 RepID=UPI001125B6B7|nr:MULTISPECIES: efflux RND transporter periplasmic adaptor subunit [unclassified Mesorhizobium]TPJ47283.1 efflux RND transporter periplasmic adaptor subunit [Mesorhizobium sp. B2-6-6]MBZ9999687.1 efflux RND transporter periplasmic adaptor subunit [Mesorhizobium sp. B264B2A]MCA0008161.1 efflux RND transporter periplasmic adaptor subunit [Mesorhizobium sp. B264B1B]MCA0017965.1 efflux RND transporter periplasmic adaptor subunit [Mesorhizobium sp. B264B1A]TPJ53414.1 efflux RND transporter peripla
MAAWKQILFALVVLVVAAAAWLRFFPGAPDVLARWGIDWAYAAPPPAETGAGTKSAGGGERARQVNVVVVPAISATINDRLQAIGTGRANASVTVNPYSSGRLAELLVSSGTHVDKGQVIATLDSETEVIAQDRARLALQDAQAKLDRVRSLRASNAATPVAVADAEVVLAGAKLALQDAELALHRRSVLAPISGTVGILPISAGNYVTNQSAIATLDDRSSILVDFLVPERFAAAVKIGAQLSATPIANPGNSYTGTVSAIDNHIDENSRTLLVKATIANPADSLRAGMSFAITMKFPGETYPAVSPLAILWGSEGAYVWAVENGKAKRVPVRIIQRNTETVLIDAELDSGDMVVTEGTQSVSEGGEVRIARGEQRAANAAEGS